LTQTYIMPTNINSLFKTGLFQAQCDVHKVTWYPFILWKRNCFSVVVFCWEFEPQNTLTVDGLWSVQHLVEPSSLVQSFSSKTKAGISLAFAPLWNGAGILGFPSSIMGCKKIVRMVIGSILFSTTWLLGLYGFLPLKLSFVWKCLCLFENVYVILTGM